MKKTQSALLLAMTLFGGTAYAAESFTPHPYFGLWHRLQLCRYGL